MLVISFRVAVLRAHYRVWGSALGFGVAEVSVEWTTYNSPTSELDCSGLIVSYSSSVFKLT